MKKRVIAGLMAGALMIGWSALADVDLSGMSYEELVDLYSNVRLEMIKRPEGEENILSGIYMVGQDIPAGRYSFELNKSSFSYGIYVILYGDKETYQEKYTSFSYSGCLYSDTVGADDSPLELPLEDGNVLIISDGSAKCSLIKLYD